MGTSSKIEWTNSSWTPIRAIDLKTGKIGWHCEHASEGCRFCYSEGMNRRLGTGLDFKPGHREHVNIFLDEQMLLAPLKWKKPRKIFVCSMTDLFADFVKDEWIDKVFAVMALCPQHTFQVLTKRAERMRAYVSQFRHDGHDPRYVVADRVTSQDPRDGNRFLLLQDGQKWPLPNVWLGVSAERQEEADERIPHLLATPAAVRFVSAEPLLGPVDLTMVRGRHWALTQHMNALTGIANPSLEGIAPKACLDWIIVGGESGHNARPMNPQWARDIRDQCHAAGVAFFHKQNGEWASVSEVEGPGAHFHFRDGRTVRRVGKKAAGRLLDGRTHDEFPEVPT